MLWTLPVHARLWKVGYVLLLLGTVRWAAIDLFSFICTQQLINGWLPRRSPWVVANRKTEQDQRQKGISQMHIETLNANTRALWRNSIDWLTKAVLKGTRQSVFMYIYWELLSQADVPISLHSRVKWYWKGGSVVNQYLRKGFLFVDEKGEGDDSVHIIIMKLFL